MTKLVPAAFYALSRADGHPLHGRSTGDLADSGTMADGVLELRWEVASYYPDKTLPAGDVYSGAELSICCSFADLDPEPLLLVSKAFFERLDALAPNTLGTIPARLLHVDGGEPLPYLGLFPKVALEPRDARNARPTDVQFALSAFDPAATDAPLFVLPSKRGGGTVVISKAVAEALDLDSWKDVGWGPFLPSPATGGLRDAAQKSVDLFEKALAHTR